MSRPLPPFIASRRSHGSAPTARTVCGIALLSLAMLADAALAAPLQCRQIDSRKERNACYEQQQRQNAKKKTPEGPPTNDTLDQMKLENDRLGKRLQGICRGC